MPAESPELTQSCLETCDQVYTRGPDPTDQAIDNPEEEWFTEGSMLSAKDGGSRAGYAIMRAHTAQGPNLCHLTLQPRGELMVLTEP